MKKLLFALTLTGLLPLTSKAQYWTSGGELIFSWANYQDSTQKLNGPPRFTLFLNLNYKYNIDFGQHFGMAFGFGIRNMGFITTNEVYAVPGTGDIPIKYDKIKRRSYNLGVPVMFKIGNVKKDRFLAIGGEYEWLFHYKEKRFISGQKTKRKAFNSNETNRFLPSVFVAYQMNDFGMIKVQYYLNDFLNKNFVDQLGNKPYANTSSQIMMISWMGNMRANKLKSKIKNQTKEDEYSAFNHVLKNVRVSY
ncbi:MAG: hypothetical protein GC180_00600 [Bacteroidetes bacterium]|nr:hypothetical protein [Bacteroidota bacterium]